jgi:hypothetical protein
MEQVFALPHIYIRLLLHYHPSRAVLEHFNEDGKHVVPDDKQPCIDASTKCIQDHRTEPSQYYCGNE